MFFHSGPAGFLGRDVDPQSDVVLCQTNLEMLLHPALL
jgi:hypothetical protein